MKLQKKWIKDCTHGEHDYVIAVHKNTKHTHAHIIVNPVNNLSGKGWDIYYKKDVAIFRELMIEFVESMASRFYLNQKRQIL